MRKDGGPGEEPRLPPSPAEVDEMKARVAELEAALRDIAEHRGCRLHVDLRDYYLQIPADQYGRIIAYRDCAEIARRALEKASARS
jgi:hypothetical protein